MARDLGQALNWYRMAADQGDSAARHRVEVGGHLLAGIARYGDDDYAAAVSEFDRALELDSDLADAYDLRGWAHGASPHPAPAIVDFSVARSLRVRQGWMEREAALDVAMQVVLVRSDVACEPDCPEWISAEGRIVPSTPAEFKRALKAMGDRRLPVIIHSPGGDVDAAMAIGRLIRAKQLDVAVGKTVFEGCAPGHKGCAPSKGRYRGMAYSVNAFCASACPLVLAAGTERLVGEVAAAAVHEVKTDLHEDGHDLSRDLPDREWQEGDS